MGSTAALWLIAWKAQQSFQVCSGSLAVSAESLVIAPGCQASIDLLADRPAALKYVGQSRPGALLREVGERPRIVGLVHVLGLDDRGLRLGDLVFQVVDRRLAFASASAMPASFSSAAT